MNARRVEYVPLDEIVPAVRNPKRHDLEPTYVDVIARRFQAFAGVVPILESTGQPHDFTAG